MLWQGPQHDTSTKIFCKLQLANYNLCDVGLQAIITRTNCNRMTYLLHMKIIIIIIYIINTKKKFTHTSITLHTDYIHDKYNIDYVKYKHTHTYT